MVGVVLGFRTSYQRTPVFPSAVRTVWFATIDSWLPKLRYARRCRRRSPIASSFCVVAGCGMQSWVAGHGAVNAATPGMEVGPVKVELLLFTKSAWNFQSCSAPEPGSMAMKKFREPVGGGVGPSKSEGKRLA